jgi:hypothetical protein
MNFKTMKRTMKKTIYCPQSGCGMPNGAAPPCPVECKNCGHGKYKNEYPLSQPYVLTNFNKVCPKCHHCLSCRRISKKKHMESKA